MRNIEFARNLTVCVYAAQMVANFLRWSMSGRTPKPTAFWAEVSGNHAGARGYEKKAFRRTPKTTVKKLASKPAPKLKKIEKPNKAQKEKPLEKPKLKKIEKPKKAEKKPEENGVVPSGNLTAWTYDEDQLLIKYMDEVAKLSSGNFDWVQITKELRKAGVQRPDDSARNRYQRLVKMQSKGAKNAKPKKCTLCGKPYRGHSCTGRRKNLVSMDADDEEPSAPAGGSLDTLLAVAATARAAEAVCLPCGPAE